MAGIHNPRTYTDKQKAEAMALAKVRGLHHASRVTTIDRHSIRRWLQRPELSELLETEETDIRRAMWVSIQIGLLQVVNQLQDPDVSLKEKAYTVFGLMDRHALLTGGVSGRIEVRSITSGYDDNEQKKLRDFIDSLPALNAEQPADAESNSG